MQIRKLPAKTVIISGVVIAAILISGIVFVLGGSNDPPLFIEDASKPLTTPDPTPYLAPETPPEQSPTTIFVHIDGHVENPGIFELPEGARVADGIEAAGGFGNMADSRSVNLAAELVDGQQIIVNDNPTPISPAPPARGDTAAGALININTADSLTLQRLSGVGPVTAQNIISHRERHGPFLSIEQLMNVGGIGQATFDRLSSYVTVN